MDNENDIGRFLEAQADRWSGYDMALSEIRNGEKVSHWIIVCVSTTARSGRDESAVVDDAV